MPAKKSSVVDSGDGAADPPNDVVPIGPDAVEQRLDDEEIVVHLPVKAARTAEIAGLSVLAFIMVTATIIAVYCCVSSRKRQKSLQKFAETLSKDSDQSQNFTNNRNNSSSPTEAHRRLCCACCRPDLALEDIWLRSQAKKNSKKRSIEDSVRLLEEGVRHHDNFQQFLKKSRTSPVDDNVNATRRSHEHRHRTRKHHRQCRAHDRSPVTGESISPRAEFGGSKESPWVYFESPRPCDSKLRDSRQPTRDQRHDTDTRWPNQYEHFDAVRPPRQQPNDRNYSARYTPQNAFQYPPPRSSNNPPIYADSLRSPQYLRGTSQPVYSSPVKPQYPSGNSQPIYRGNLGSPQYQRNSSQLVYSTNPARPHYQTIHNQFPYRASFVDRAYRNSNRPPYDNNNPSNLQYQNSNKQIPNGNRPVNPQYQQNIAQHVSSQRHLPPQPENLITNNNSSNYPYEQQYVQQTSLPPVPHYSYPYFPDINYDPTRVDSYGRLNVSQNYNCEDSGISSFPSNSKPAADQTPSLVDAAGTSNLAAAASNPAVAVSNIAGAASSSAAAASVGAPGSSTSIPGCSETSAKQNGSSYRTLPRMADNIASACQTIASTISRKQNSQYQIVPNSSPEAKSNESGSFADRDNRSSSEVSSGSDSSVGRKKDSLASRIPWLRIFSRKNATRPRKAKPSQGGKERLRSPGETKPLLKPHYSSESEDTPQNMNKERPQREGDAERVCHKNCPRSSSSDFDPRESEVPHKVLTSFADEHGRTSLDVAPGCSETAPKTSLSSRFSGLGHHLRKRDKGYKVMVTHQWCEEHDSWYRDSTDTHTSSLEGNTSCGSLGPPASNSTPSKGKLKSVNQKLRPTSIGPSLSDIQTSALSSSDQNENNDMFPALFPDDRDEDDVAYSDRDPADATESASLINFDNFPLSDEFGPFIGGPPKSSQTKSTERSRNLSDVMSRSREYTEVSGAPFNFSFAPDASRNSLEMVNLSKTSLRTAIPVNYQGDPRDRSSVQTTEMPAVFVELTGETDFYGPSARCESKFETDRVILEHTRRKSSQKVAPKLSDKMKHEQRNKTELRHIPEERREAPSWEPEMIYQEVAENAVSSEDESESRSLLRKPVRRALFGKEDACLPLDEFENDIRFRGDGADQTKQGSRKVITSSLSSSVI